MMPDINKLIEYIDEEILQSIIWANACKEIQRRCPSKINEKCLHEALIINEELVLSKEKLISLTDYL